MHLITKSRYLIGVQCPVWLWKEFNAKQELPEVDQRTQDRFDAGKEIGDLAKGLFKGEDLAKLSFADNLKRTKELVAAREAIFEAGFKVGDLYSRADILAPKGDLWDIYEVKSSTEVKGLHIHDLAFQRHVYEAAGLKIGNVFLVTVNNEYVREGKNDIKKLFKINDLNHGVSTALKDVPATIEKIRQTINSTKCPELRLSKQCDSEYGCPVHDAFIEQLPKGSVMEFYRGNSKAAGLYDSGIRLLKDVPTATKLTDKQQIQKECAVSGKAFIAKEQIRHFIKQFTYPLFFLDFETYGFSIPMFNQSRPYQQIPFQFSLHVVSKDGKEGHFEFLADSQEDPRPAFAKALQDCIGETGSIVTYNKGFEASRLKELARDFPKHKKWIENACGRMVDLLVPFQNFYYYHPDQQGSASIKSVLPVMADISYSGLKISNGNQAMGEWYRISFTQVNDDEKQAVRQALLKYCGLDTRAMILLHNTLVEMVK